MKMLSLVSIGLAAVVGSIAGWANGQHAMTAEPQSGPFPLSQAHTGEALRLVRIDAGCRLAHRLIELGLTPGVALTIIQNSGGPLLISVRDSRVALGRGMAHKLQVQRA